MTFEYKESFKGYEEEVNTLIDLGNQLTGADFIIDIEKYPHLSQLTVSCDPPLPGRHPVESTPGRGGIEINMPGRQKTGGSFPITFTEVIKGAALREYGMWAHASPRAEGRVKVRVFSAHEIGDSGLDITYLGCWPEVNDINFDYESKTSVAKFTCNLHFAHRMWTPKAKFKEHKATESPVTL